MMRHLRLLPLIVMFFVIVGPVSRALADDLATCRDANGDVAIAACTRSISSARLHGHNLALEYNDRGFHYASKGDYDRAIADYNKAIRLDPKFVLTYNNRGNAYREKGDNDRGIADYNQAMRLDPKDVLAYYNRGNAYYDSGADDRAIADFTEAIQIDPKYEFAYVNLGDAYRAKGDYDSAIANYAEAVRLDPKDVLAYYNRGLANLYAGAVPKALADLEQASILDPKHAYAALWLEIVGQRSDVPSRLSQAISVIDMKVWPAPVIRLFLGQMPPPAVLAAADNPDKTTKNGQICEANFYSGEWAQRHGAKDEAAHLFRLAAAECPKGFDEWFAANAELKAIGAAP